MDLKNYKLDGGIDYTKWWDVYQVDYKQPWHIPRKDEPNQLIQPYPAAIACRIVTHSCNDDNTLNELVIQHGTIGEVRIIEATKMWKLNYDKLKLYCLRNNIPRSAYKNDENYRQVKYRQGQNRLHKDFVNRCIKDASDNIKEIMQCDNIIETIRNNLNQ